MSTRPLWSRWARVGFYGGAIIATGVVLFKYTTPTDEQLIASFSPEVRAEYEKSRELRQKEQQALMEIVKKTSALNDPIWKTGSIKSPFEKDGRYVDPKLVDPQALLRESAAEQQRIETEEANRKMEETERLLNEKGKKWWSWK